MAHTASIRVTRVFAAVGSILLPSHVLARSADTTPPVVTPANTGQGDILVTARKREERNIDVPTTVQAFSAATLEKKQIQSVNGLYATVPNLYFSSNLLSPGRDFLNLVIRGVGAQSAGQPAVATIVDGVYQPSLAFDTGFLDASSVEVLKGPQGTIFGRNTEGGALNIILRKPDDKVRGSAAMTFDSFASANFQARLSGPIASSFFGSIAIQGSTTEGFLKNPTLGEIAADDRRSFSGRVALRYHPDSALDIVWAVDGSNTKGLDGLPGVPRARRKYEVLNTFQIDAAYKNLGGSLNASYDFGNVKVTSLTGARKLSSQQPYDFSGGPVDGIVYPNELMDLHSEQSIVSEELRVEGSSLSDSLHWLAGGYVFREKDVSLRRLSLPFLPTFGTSYTSRQQDQRLVNTGFAFFADATYELTKRLSVDLGVRYGKEKTTSNLDVDLTVPGIVTVNGSAQGSITTSYLTPSASLLYHITPNATVYARYARGERGGGFPLAPLPFSDIPFKAEKTDNFEIGTKGRIFGGVLGYDFSAFYIKIINQQVQSITFINNDPTLPVATTTNAGKSSSRGFEANINVNPVRTLSLAASLGYVDAHYDSYIDTVGASRAGERFPFVPRFSAAGSAEYTIILPRGRSLTLTGEYQHVGRILSGSGVDIDLQFDVKAYDLVNFRASLAVTPKVKLDVFVKNAFDRYIETRVFNTFFFAGPRPFSQLLPPRSVGGRISYTF